MRTLNFELKKMCERNKDGSFSTQDNRQRILSLIANQLHELGYRNLKAGGLKPKHVQSLVERWKIEGLSAGTRKNRMSHLRWWAQKVNKSSVIAKSNDNYDIERRVFVTNVSKAKVLDTEKLAVIDDAYIKVSLKLQAEFGLRKAECMKINPSIADNGDHISLKASWCKGGRARDVLIRNDYQRESLNEAKMLSKKGSLIPTNLTYVEQKRIFEYQTAKAGIDNVHGLRHAYAQKRYFELTGRLAPAAGGKTSKELTRDEKQIDRIARLTISEELGHEREQITAIYLGR